MAPALAKAKMIRPMTKVEIMVPITASNVMVLKLRKKRFCQRPTMDQPTQVTSSVARDMATCERSRLQTFFRLNPASKMMGGSRRKKNMSGCTRVSGEPGTTVSNSTATTHREAQE